jgi:D-xylonolactonase
MDLHCVWDAKAELGEGPLWSSREQALYWVDILQRRLHRYALGETPRQHHWQFDEEISSAAERMGKPGLVVTLRHGFAFFDPATEKLERLVAPEAHLPGNRFNDGKCDRQGRYWAGTIDFDCKAPTGSLYRLTPDMHCEMIDSGYPVTNGPAWSADQRTMYFNDSVYGRVHAFDFDPETGNVANKRLFLQFGAGEGSPDGMTTDAEGGLWIAHWGAGKLTRHDSEGVVLMTITLPVSQVTSCSFGGPDLSTLYITSAAVGLTPAQRLAEPLAGGLFAAEPGIAGLPADMFRG